MKAWIISDLHMASRDAMARRPLERVPAADVAIVAGDVCERPSAAIAWLSGVVLPAMRVVFVMGNHEFYGTEMNAARRDAARIARDSGVDLLDNGTVEIDGVRFTGGSLWMDFELDGTDRAQVLRTMQIVGSGLNDFRHIRWKDDGGERLFRPKDALRLHRECLAGIEEVLATPYGGPTVVVTHHAPHRGSIAPRYVDDPVTPGFASDLATLIERTQPDLWVHGHTHNACDHRVGRTRIVNNPRGYSREITGCVWDKVVEIGE